MGISLTVKRDYRTTSISVDATKREEMKMRITQAIAAKPVGLRNKALCILIILSLLGQAAPVLAHDCKWGSK